MEINSTELKEKIKRGDKILVDFWAEWCGPCKVMKPIFDKVATTYINGVELYTFNIESDIELVKEFGIMGVPTLKGYSDGELKVSTAGLKNERELIKLIESIK